jgi:hypothetical protein
MRTGLVLLALAAGTLPGQTVINGDRRILGKWDASVATATIPFSVGAVADLPASCVEGQMYFATDGTAGQNLYGCAANTWRPMGYRQGTTAAMPASCAAGELYFATDEAPGANLYACASANTWARIGGTGAVSSVFGRTGAVTAQTGDYTKAQVGLGNVDNTPDAAKPISTATQSALNGKMPAVAGSGVLKLSSGAPGLVNGSAGDCVKVDGSSGACGSGGGTAAYSCPAAGEASISCAHNLGTTTPQVWCYDGSGNLLGGAGTATEVTGVTATSANLATITFSAPTTGVCKIGTGAEGPQGPAGLQGPAGPQGPAGTGSGDMLASVYDPAARASQVLSDPGANGIVKRTSSGATAVAATADFPGALRVRTCEITVGDPAGPTLVDGNDSPVLCGNKTGAPLTITAVECYADAGSPTVMPALTGGSSTSILSGPLTCGAGSFAGGTLNGAPTQANGESIDANIVAAGGTAKYIVIRITRTL